MKDWILKGYQTERVNVPGKINFDHLAADLRGLGESTMEKENAEMRRTLFMIWAEFPELEGKDFFSPKLLLKEIRKLTEKRK